MKRVIEWAKQNPTIASSIVTVITAVLIAATGWNWVIRPANPDEKPGVVIVYEKQPATTQK
jgi:hypothetical protein